MEKFIKSYTVTGSIASYTGHLKKFIFDASPFDGLTEIESPLLADYLEGDRIELVINEHDFNGQRRQRIAEIRLLARPVATGFESVENNSIYPPFGCK